MIFWFIEKKQESEKGIAVSTTNTSTNAEAQPSQKRKASKTMQFNPTNLHRQTVTVRSINVAQRASSERSTARYQRRRCCCNDSPASCLRKSSLPYSVMMCNVAAVPIRCWISEDCEWKVSGRNTSELRQSRSIR